MVSDDILTQLKKRLTDSENYLMNELRQIRTGKSSPSMVEDIEVDAYGGQTKMKIRELATIAVDGPQALIIDPFDVSTVQDIEKAILKSPLQLSPKVEGKRIRIMTPPLSQEQREKFVKLANQKIEDGRVQLRFGRDESRKQVKASLDNKEISEDERFRIEKEIDKITKEFTDLFDDLKKRKHDEIMQI